MQYLLTRSLNRFLAVSRPRTCPSKSPLTYPTGPPVLRPYSRNAASSRMWIQRSRKSPALPKFPHSQHVSSQIPYWNEVPDAGAFANSTTILDFGGEGEESSNYTIPSGPFADLTVHLGPGMTNTDHRLKRKGDVRNSVQANQTYVDTVMSAITFAQFQNSLSRSLHGAGHGGIGGDVSSECFC